MTNFQRQFLIEATFLQFQILEEAIPERGQEQERLLDLGRVQEPRWAAQHQDGQRHSEGPLQCNCQMTYLLLHIGLAVNYFCNYQFDFFFKWANPGLFFIHFRLFNTQITKFSTNRYVKKCPSSLWCWDSNSRLLEHESPPITTRSGLLPLVWFLFKLRSG